MREEKRKKTAFHKSGPLNLLFDRTKSMVKLINFVLSFVVKDEFPNSKYLSQGSVSTIQKSIFNN